MNLALIARRLTLIFLEKTKLFSLLWKIKPMRSKLWALFAQKGELSFHKTLGMTYRMSDDFKTNSKLFFEKLKYDQNSYKNKNILDVGAGSKLRSAFFVDANIFAIEPLADKYSKLPQSDLHTAKKVYSKSAETFIDEFNEKFDFIMCINVLDHCYDEIRVLSNVYKYLNSNGEFLLSVDIHKKHDDPMHPISLTKEKLFSNLKMIGFNIREIYETIDDFSKSESTVTLKLTR
jgi:SAM-dependent methyltransferase